MRSWITRGLAALTLLCLTAACGGGSGQNRPYVVGTWPAQGQPSSGPLPFIRVDFNEPVTFLNPADYRILVDGGGFGTFVTRFADDPDSVYVFPTGRTAFPQASQVYLRTIQGLVVNSLRHYALNEFETNVFSGLERNLPIGEAAAVSLVNCLTGATAETVATPGGRAPVGVLSTTRGTTRRIWVQLENGGGAGEALAYFSPGDGAMTTVSLPTAGDLEAVADTMTLGPRGRTLYIAFRDTATAGVVLFTVDTDTAAVGGPLEILSIPTGASTMPRGMDVTDRNDGETLHIVADDGATGTQAYVTRATLTEVDQDPDVPGMQGATLLVGGGPTIYVNFRTVIATDGGTDATIVADGDPAKEVLGTVTGTTTSFVKSPDGQMALHGLDGFAGIEMLQLRRGSNFFETSEPVEVSDDIGGASQGATSVAGIAFHASSDIFLVILHTPGGAMLTEWIYSGTATFEQVDLDGGTAGVQGIPLAVDPVVIGRNAGAFPD